MTQQEIFEAIAELNAATRKLEDLYVELGGEETEETAALEAAKEAIRQVLLGEGVDDLGRWYKSKQDERDTAKAELETTRRRIKSLDNTLDYISGLIGIILDAAGETKVKGSWYGFARTTSTKSSVLQDEIDGHFLPWVEEAARKAGLPEGIDVVLKTTTTALKDHGLDEFYVTETTPAVRFSKPRQTK